VRLDIVRDVHCSAVVDPLAFQQILLNLVINSREALDGRGKITIAITCDREFVTLRVTDDGPGIPAEIRDRIFGPFFTTKEAGTGLGLATVQQLVDDSQGSIELEAVTKGASFVIKWPALGAEGLDAVKPLATPEPVSEGAHVLVVDDNEPVRRTMASLLTTFQFEVTEASDGLEALSLLERTRPDIVVTDNAMPGITGVELAVRIRESYPQLPILIVSGNPLEDLPVSNCTFLPKPFGGQALTLTINTLLSSQGARS
jgi:CheY-like chemotaxis protein